MICFEVSVNGRVLCTAGVDAARGDRPAGVGALVCALGSFAERPGDAPPRLTLDVDGLADEVRMVWLERFDALAVGDTISVRILHSARADPPAATHDRTLVQMEREVPPPERTCSFCHRPQSDARRLIAGPPVFICTECAVVAQDLAGGRHGSGD